MKLIELTLARIGNSRGIRLPADLIRKHALRARASSWKIAGTKSCCRPKDRPLRSCPGRRPHGKWLSPAKTGAQWDCHAWPMASRPCALGTTRIPTGEGGSREGAQNGTTCRLPPAQSMKRGDIHWVTARSGRGQRDAQDPAVRDRQPGLELNAVLPTVVVCPLTSAVAIPKWRARLQVTMRWTEG